jgi:hypothetical protein
LYFYSTLKTFFVLHSCPVTTLLVSCLLQELKSTWELYAQSELPLGSLLIWDVTQCTFVFTDFSGQPIGPIFNGQSVQGTYVMNYQSTVRNIPGTQSSHLQLGDSLITVTIVMLKACHLYSSLKEQRGFLPMEEERVKFSKKSTFWKLYWNGRLPVSINQTTCS